MENPTDQQDGNGYTAAPMSNPASGGIDSGISRPRRTTSNLRNPSQVTWDPITIGHLVRICAIEVLAGNIPGVNLNPIGWKNVFDAMGEATSKVWKHEELKNLWDRLRYEWNVWVHLRHKATRLGWTVERGTISAPDYWWDEVIEDMPEARKFRQQGHIHYDDQYTCFSDYGPTGLHAVTSNANPPITDCQQNAVLGENNSGTPRSAPAFVTPPVIEESGSSWRVLSKDRNEELFADVLEKMAKRYGEEVNSQTCSVIDCIQVLNGIPEIESVDDLWFFAAEELFRREHSRQVFMAMKSNEGRLRYLRKAFAKSMGS